MSVKTAQVASGIVCDGVNSSPYKATESLTGNVNLRKQDTAYFIKMFNFYRALRLSGKRLWLHIALYGALGLLCSTLTPGKSRTDDVMRERHDCLGSHFCQSWHTYIFIITYPLFISRLMNF